MKKKTTMLIVPVLMGLVALGWAVNQNRTEAPGPTGRSANALPRLLDLGADKCIPCKKMAPILEGMKEEFAGRLQVDFIDVWKNPNEAPKYKVTTIPTQIFLDPEGNELLRHVGFFSREDILKTWSDHGYTFTAPAGEADES